MNFFQILYDGFCDDEKKIFFLVEKKKYKLKDLCISLTLIFCLFFVNNKVNIESSRCSFDRDNASDYCTDDHNLRLYVGSHVGILVGLV